MKTLFLITLLNATTLVSVCAQDSLTVNIAVIVKPAGSISLVKQEETKGFKVITPLLLGTLLKHKDNLLFPHYNIGANAFGLTYIRNVHPKVQVYALFNKSVIQKGGYALCGVATPLGPGQLFVEMGSTWHNWSPDVNIGLIIPFTIRIK